MTTDDQLDAIFSALANPTRRAMLARLAEGDATVNELAEPFNMSLPAISKHIRVLENGGLITRSKDAQFRPCQINAKRLRDVAHWTEQYRPIWDVRFAAMDKAMQAIKENDDE